MKRRAQRTTKCLASHPSHCANPANT